MEGERRRQFLLAGLFMGLFFASLDQTVVGTAMPRIIGDLGGLGIMTWVTTAYMLTSTTVVPIAGKLSDLYGRRDIYVSGLVLFMIGSALCGLSTSMTQLIVFRAIQGIGGGIMMPLSMTIVGDLFPPEQRGKWQGWIGAVFGLSSIVGPTLGGWLVDFLSWHWVFYVNLPIGILAALAIYIGLLGEKPLKEEATIDYSGAGALVLATVLLLLALNLGGVDFPWLSWQILSMILLSFLIWALFFWLEKRATDPILSLHLFQNRVFVVINLLGFLMGLGMFGSIMFLPLFWQGVQGLSATASGNSMLPMMFAMMLTSIVGGRMAVKLSFRTIFIFGMAFMAFGFYLLSTLTVHTNSWLSIGYITVLGIGMGLIMPTLTIAVQQAFPAQERGTATAATQFFRSIGGTFGMTILGVLFNQYSSRVLEQQFFPILRSVPQLSSGPAAPLAEKARSDPHGLFNLLLSPETLQRIPENLQPIFMEPLKVILADSLQIVFVAAMVVSILGIFASVWLGQARLGTSSSVSEAAGTLLFAEAAAGEVELSAELVPDLIGDSPRQKK